MKLTSPALGEIEVDEDRVIEFPNGLVGLPHLRRFVLVHEENDSGATPKVFLLQSVDEPEMTFSVVPPDTIGVRYEIDLKDEEVALLQAQSPDDLVLAVIVRRSDEKPESHGLTANFMGPLLINTRTRRGMQKVLEHLNCDVVIRG
jgi:flagellar assembly factor FliW